MASRNAGVQWVLNNEPTLSPGVIYFGDDDNTYDFSLLEEIRQTRLVSMFSVGFVGDNDFSSQIIHNFQVIGFSDPWFAGRKFPVDMAGFAVNIELLKKYRPKMPYLAGFEETLFHENMNVTFEDIEPRANYCTEILVWHTQTKCNGPIDLRRQGP